MGELVVARRYWCHMCATAVSPVVAEAGVEIKCPYCGSGFLEEMETARSSVAAGTGHASGTYPSADNAISIWAPIIDSMVGDPVRRRRSNRRTVDAVAAAEDELDNVDFSRRRRRATAFLRLLQAIRERQLQRLESAAALGAGGGLEAEHYSPFGRSIFAAAPLGEHGMALGDYFLGPGLDALMQQLADSDAGRQGTPPAKKDAVEALPTVEVVGCGNEEDAASCAVCLEDYASGERARELPCRHRFHSQCIVPWLEMHSSCPFCRFQLPADDDPKSSCGSGSGSGSVSTTTTTYVTYVSGEVNDNVDDHGNGRDEAEGNAAVERQDGDVGAEGNVSRLPASIQWLNSLFSPQGTSPSSTSTSTSGGSSRHFED
ncbi:hypothetical protein ZWY2020_033990 [Hordeum vulgare]|nr:hypothetical protein ZWY2020_033990 [Hordeum vulgare]